MRLKILTLLLLISPFSMATNYVWQDKEGVKHISTVPRECITESKTIDINCNIPSGDRVAVERYQKRIKEKQRQAEIDKHKKKLAKILDETSITSKEEDKNEKYWEEYEARLKRNDPKGYEEYKIRERARERQEAKKQAEQQALEEERKKAERELEALKQVEN